MKKMNTLISRTITILGGALLALLFVAQFLILSHPVLDDSEQMVFLPNGPVFWAALAAELFLLRFFAGKLLKLPSRALFLILSVIFTLGALYVIFRVPAYTKGDAGIVVENAQRFLAGNYAGLEKGHYLYFWPHQLGLVTWDAFLLRFSDSVRILFLANIGFTLLLDYFQWRIAAHLFRKDQQEECAAEKLTIIFSFAFLPLLFFVLFAYGFVPGLCFAEAAFLFLIRFSQNGGVGNLILCPVFLELAFFFKPNYLIAAIALCIVIVLLFLEHRKKAYLALLAACVLVILLHNKGLCAHYRNVSGENFGNGVPKILTITMSILPEYGETSRVGGWYNGYEFDAFQSADYDEMRGEAIGWQKFHETTAYWATHPAQAFRFFRDKFLSTWCDPLYESVWVGPLVDDGIAIDDPIMESLYAGDYAYLFAEKWMTALAVILFAGAAWYYLPPRLSKRGEPILSLYPLLFLMGGVCLHLISETKSQYAFTYVYCIIPFAAYTWGSSRLLKKGVSAHDESVEAP